MNACCLRSRALIGGDNCQPTGWTYNLTYYRFDGPNGPYYLLVCDDCGLVIEGPTTGEEDKVTEPHV